MPDLPGLLVRLDPAGAPGLPVGTPVLAGEAVETLFPAAQPCGRSGAFGLFRDGDWLLGQAQCEVGDDAETATHRLYADLFGAVGPHALARVWNYVPSINDVALSGMENYRAFCRGRSLAFEERFGPAFAGRAPAASAVGCEGGVLTIVFAAHAGGAEHIENPLQVPAYDYPAEHGPRAPTFSRATIVTRADQRRTVFLSGTSAIRGHASVAPGDTPAQLACTLENLRELAVACGLGPDFASARPGRRHIKVYLRHAADLGHARAQLEGPFIRPEDRVSYVRADICRRELNVEIEVSLLDVAPA